jgi:hypothetical protein
VAAHGELVDERWSSEEAAARVAWRRCCGAPVLSLEAVACCGSPLQWCSVGSPVVGGSA